MPRNLMILMLLAVVYVTVNQVYSDESECTRHEAWHKCGKLCEPTCDNPHPKHYMCPRTRCSKSTAACRCRVGFVRDADGYCVRRADCDLS